ncbi:hypothetical protein BU107_05800 [Staphylococcus xylosus]|uniref:SH3 domain-containing protein n=1 Tax=Staphylococcus xylosus TaxID=1288 RepID=UPI000E67A451|nr:SH3 domain-containing protein [Staphylococcus xylosus]RIM88314.1 hypothetical protein BU107_05800 [Staphylococcus xylosus]
MLTAIDYLTKKGWKISSDPRTYSGYPKNYGFRNYTANGINYDSYCGGYHRAFDLYNNNTNDIPAVTSGKVITANDYGNFGGTFEIRDANGNDWIYGHLRRGSMRFKVGDTVNQGDIIGLQGNSNYYDNSMNAHLHIQLRPKGTNLNDEKTKVCSGIPMEKYDISHLGEKLKTSKEDKESEEKKLKHIYSSHIKGDKITNPKSSIAGIVIHNDYGSMTPSQYLPWLYSREANGTHVNGWASVYADRNEVLWYHPTDYIEWHCGNQWANNNLIGFEVCGSYPGHLSDEAFLQNEEATLKIAAEVMKSYGLPVNRKTVNLHRQYFGTSCPHRSWDIHVGKNAADTKENRLKLIDYFIKRIKHYYNGGSTPSDISVKVKAKSKSQKQQNKKSNSEWKQNQYGTWYKAKRGTFTNGNVEIQVRRTGPFRLSDNKAGKLQPGVSINYDEVMLQDGHVWIGYTSFEGERLYLPVRTWNGVAPPKQGLGSLWGRIS